MTTTDPKADCREAFADWQAQFAKLHGFFLDGARLPPQQIKAC